MTVTVSISILAVRHGKQQQYPLVATMALS